MIREKVTYENPITGEIEEEIIHLNLTASELLKFMGDEETQTGKDLMEHLQNMASGELKMTEILAFFESICSIAYGKVTPNGRGFEKSEELTKEFMGSFAYDALLEKLFFSEDSSVHAERFVQGILPKTLLQNQEIQKKMNEVKDMGHQEGAQEVINMIETQRVQPNIQPPTVQ